MAKKVTRATAARAKKSGKAPKKTTVAAKKKAKGSSKPATRKVSTTSKRGNSKPTSREAASLGRPKVTGEEQLFMLFKDDYHARQVFDFLRVQTVRELEEFSPDQIIKLLSKPVTDAVERIRQKLAEKNRALKNDTPFAIQYQQKQQTSD